MNKKNKKELYKILCSGLCFTVALLLEHLAGGGPGFVLPQKLTEALGIAGEASSADLVFLLAYLVAGYGVIAKALRNIRHGQIFDENFLMTIASLGAFILGQHAEGVAVMLFYKIGELFENMAVEKSRGSIASLMAIRPDYAVLLSPPDRAESRVDPYDVQVGDKILIRPGEKVPLDGVVVEGFSSLDTAAITGEALPKEVALGDKIYSGSVNLNGVLVVEVTKVFEESTVSKILDLVENAGSKKAETEKFITKFARIYTPAVVIVAAVLALLPPLVIPGAAFSDWVYRAMVFLVISCPCALVISVPLSFFAGVGSASKIGVLVKGSNYLEALSRAETVIFDKTGTLTSGVFNLEQILPVDGLPQDALLKLAAYGEYHSNHPLAVSIKKAYEDKTGLDIIASIIKSVEEVAGKGLIVYLSDKEQATENQYSLEENPGSGEDENENKNTAGLIELHIGNMRLMGDLNISPPSHDFVGTLVYVAVNKIYAGALGLADGLKPDAEEGIKQLKKLGISKTVLLTGDVEEVASHMGKKLSMDQVFSRLLPEDKVIRLEEILKEKSPGKTVIFVGDGINDAPALARADVGIAMGGLGSDAAIEAADIVIMTDEPSKIAKVMKISQKTLRVAQQNIVFALGVKGLILILGAAGFASMWAAVFADVGVAMLAILNSIRLLKD